MRCDAVAIALGEAEARRARRGASVRSSCSSVVSREDVGRPLATNCGTSVERARCAALPSAPADAWPAAGAFTHHTTQSSDGRDRRAARTSHLRGRDQGNIAAKRDAEERVREDVREEERDAHDGQPERVASLASAGANHAPPRPCARSMSGMPNTNGKRPMMNIVVHDERHDEEAEALVLAERAEQLAQRERRAAEVEAHHRDVAVVDAEHVREHDPDDVIEAYDVCRDVEVEVLGRSRSPGCRSRG